MKITRNNYEVFIIDFFDGKLDAETTSALLLFLDENPDLKEEFELFKQPLPKPEQIIFEKKETLKKQAVKAVAEINEDNYENYFIGFYEGDLNQNEKADLEIFLGINEFLKEEFELFGKVYLQADCSTYFPGKESLKKKSDTQILYYAVSVAAIVLLFFSIYPIFKSEIPSVAVFERTQLSSMQKVNPFKNISLPASATIYFSDKKNKSVVLLEENTFERESEFIASVISREITIEELQTADYALAENETEFLVFKSIPKNGLPEKEKKSALGRVINKNVGGLLAIFKKESKNTNKDNEPVFVKVLDQSLIVFNTITGSDKELTKVYNKEGQLSSYGFETGTININRQVGQHKE